MLERQAAELAATMAGKLLSRLPADAATEPMFRLLVDRVRGLPPAQRQRIAGAGGPVEIVTAGPLGDADQARYRAALEAALDHPVSTSFRADPTLIAGFELHAPDTVITNSWRADLEAISRQVALAEDAPADASEGDHHAA